jgi:hypothetical protein
VGGDTEGPHDPIKPCLALLALLLPVAAVEFSPQSSSNRLWFFAEGAAIVRRIPVVLPARPTTLVIDDLPAVIEADSLKIDGAADQAIAIAAVEMRIPPADPEKEAKRKAPSDDRPSTVLRALGTLRIDRIFLCRGG